jgi:tetratricopeptide (TPR) repeat protein
MLACMILLTGCSATVSHRPATPEASPVPTTLSEPADIAVFPFENRTGDASLNWLRTALSATLSVRLKEKRGFTTVDGSFIRQAMTDQGMEPSAILSREQAISMSGLLFAESLVTGVFEGKENALTLTASLISGETGEVKKTASLPVSHNDRSGAINALIDLLTREGSPEPDPLLTSASSAPLPPARSRIRNPRPQMDAVIGTAVPLPLDTPDQIEQAIRLYRQTLESNPDFPDAHFALGYAYEKQGDAAKALAAYRQAVILNPLNADYLYTLAYAYERRRDYRQAIKTYKEALAITPNDAEIAFSLGYAHEQIGEYAEAISAYKHAIALNPADYDAHQGLASVYEASGQLSQALEQYRELMTIQPAEMSFVKTFSAIAVRLQRWEEAIAACQTLIQRNPEDLEAYEMLAQACRAQGDTGRAIAVYQEIIRLAPARSAAYTNLGNIYVRLKQYDRAVQQYRAGLKADPASSILYYNLGTVLVVQKDYRGALDAYTRYLKLEPDGPYAETVEKKIEDLRFKAMTEQ